MSALFTSAKDLIARKTEIEARTNKTVTVTVGDLGDWRFKVPNAAEILDAQVYARKHKDGADGAGDTFLVYNQCEEPNLHDQELQKAFDNPGADIVNHLLNPGEVSAIAHGLMARAGYYEGAAGIIMQGAEAVKNA